MDNQTQMLETVLAEVKELRRELQASRRAVLTREEAAAYLTISVRNLHDLVQRGKIKRVVLSEGRFAFRRDELDRYLAEHEVIVEDAAERNGKRLYAEAMGRTQ